ncbi:restriction endonuclease subunit S [Lacticaseibacillus paracasei]|uniref:restriction endonuclease subunit S n=1 Tax=Lacticaseibacillus paracasei TaxID=1597 RepID=UPI000FF0DD60|nr:restriction endonuclease subunit S [Lacticaseibacillus paracasei]RNE40947.1 EcoKI restriction-modification system protein HsdS [Lacticaseibacillus paracasei]
MNAEQHVPPFRFKGFSDFWEQRKLSDLAMFNPRLELPDSFQYVDLESVSGTELINHRTETKSSAPSRAQRLAKKGDIFYQTVRPYQKNNYLYEKSDDDYVFSTGYAQLRPYEDGYFLFSRLQENGFVSTVLDHSTGTSYPAINSNDLAKLEIMVPLNLNEQQAIGKLFRHIDNAIALHQHKLAKLKELKKGYLQKLFPQNGETVPEFRFKGYSDAWEKRKLGELMNVRSVKRVHQSDWRQEGVPFLRARDIIAINNNQKVKEPIYISKDMYKRFSEQSGRVSPGDLLVTGVGSIGIPFLIKSEDPIYFKDGNIIWFQNKTLDPDFFYFQFMGNSIQTYILSTSGKGTVGTYTITAAKDTPIVFPKKAEQKQIGLTLRNLDNLIAATHCKLDLLKKLKKGYLQKMFC